jgi:hypothetical protein
LLQRLLKLYSKQANSGKTPLEDFTTEALAALLEEYPKFKEGFITDFLCLPKDKYFVKTQKKFFPANSSICIIDLVLLGEKNTCFIENKVNSKEGFEQLKQYSGVLDNRNNDNHDTFLFYCTKNHDRKEHSKHNFKQYRWHELAKFMQDFMEIHQINDFIKYLTINNMAQDNTLLATDFTVLENIQTTLSKCYEFIESVKPEFENKFCRTQKISEGKLKAQIRDHNRITYYVKEIVKGGSWSELMYGIYLNVPCIFVHIYLDKDSINHNKFIQASELSGKLELKKYDHGSKIYLEKNLSQLLNDQSSDEQISKWYTDTFQTFDDFIRKSKLNVWNT